MSRRLLSAAGSSSWRAAGRPHAGARCACPWSVRMVASSSTAQHGLLRGPVSLAAYSTSPVRSVARPSSRRSSAAEGEPPAPAPAPPAPEPSPAASDVVDPASSGVKSGSAFVHLSSPQLPPVMPDAPDSDARRFTAVAQASDPSSSSSAAAAAPLPAAHPNTPALDAAAMEAEPVRRSGFSPVISLRPSPPARGMAPTPAAYSGLWKVYFLAKEYFLFLCGGVKISLAEWREMRRIRRASIQDGHQLTYQDITLFRRVKANNRRMLPFLFLALTIEELIPILILFAPQFVPSTGLLPSQATKMHRDLEDKLVRNRSAVYARLQKQTNDDGSPVYPAGWRGEGAFEWQSDEIKELLRVFSWPNRELTRRYLEDHARSLHNFLEEDDRYLMDRPPPEGFTADEFRRILSARGLLSLDMPDTDLPAKLDAYLTARRTQPTFHPFEYVLRDISLTQPAAEAALAEREAARAKAEEEEKARNGGYSGWKAVARRAFVESSPAPIVDGGGEAAKRVKPTDPSLSPVHTIEKATLSAPLSARPTKRAPPSPSSATAPSSASSPSPAAAPSSPPTNAAPPAPEAKIKEATDERI